MVEATPPRPTAPIYPFDEPGREIVFHEGDIEVVGVGKGPGTISVTMNGDIDIEWQVELPTRFELGDVTLRLHRPDLGLIEVDAVVNHSGGRGWIQSASLGSGQKLSRVLVHWVNLPWILPANALGDDRGAWGGRWEAQGAGWSMVLNCRPDLARIFPLMKQSRYFAVTYTGELRRVDGSPFEVDSAVDALYGWQVALSFALGRWVAPALPVGFDVTGRRAWEQWAPWRCDEVAGYTSWWDSHNGEDLKDFVALFLGAWQDQNRRDLVWYMCHSFIAANQRFAALEARILLVQAALEYFSSTRVRPQSGHMNSRANRLRELLALARIPAGLTAAPSALRQFAAEKNLADGPELVAYLRNRLTHPKDVRELYRIQHLVFRSWELSMQYCELLLLHELGYRGQFCRRIPPREWAHTREPVPWV